MTSRGCAVMVVTVLLAHAGSAALASDGLGPFRGQIVDQETGGPIEGAVVLFEWRTASESPLGHPSSDFLIAREAVTDARGDFDIPRLQISAPPPAIRQPVAYFVAGGYLRSPYFLGRSTPSSVLPPLTISPRDGDPFVDLTVVPMQRASTAEEWCRHGYSFLPFGADIPHAQMPRFLELMRREAATRGPCNPRRR